MTSLLVDTSVWSLAYRRDSPPDLPEVQALRTALLEGEWVAITGMILLELLRGFVPAKAQSRIIADLASVDFLTRPATTMSQPRSWRTPAGSPGSNSVQWTH